MLNFTRIIALFTILIVTNRAYSQFPYSETFRNSSASSGIVFGGGDNPSTEGHAFLTAGNSNNTMPVPDADGNGYLRLTNNLQYQKGYIYNKDIEIPSTNGLKIEFEYNTYSPPGTLFPRGADGICFFLFDANVLQTTGFKIGGFGGSLGYAQYHKKDVPTSSGLIEVHADGVTGGYLGLGIDEYGYFARDEEGRQPQIGAGKQPSPQPGSVVIRGKGTGDAELPGNYPLLAFQRTSALATPFNLVGNNNARQPDPTNLGYRKAIILLEPHPSGGYNISVDIVTGDASPVTHRIINQYHYKDAAPEKLGYGLSSATGNNVNIHEIRNLKIELYEDKPIGISDEVTTLTNLPVTVPVKVNDLSKLNTIVIRATDPTNGTYTILNSDSEINYVPNPGFSGTDIFTYKLYDTVTGKESNPITVTINVKPVGSPDIQSTPVNTPVTINGKSNDISKTGTTVVPVTNPTSGSISVNAATGQVVYTPNQNYEGPDQFTYKLVTVDGLESDPIIVDVTVTPSGLTPAKIGLAKALISVNKNIDGNFTLKYRFTIVNVGDITIDRLSLQDNLVATFPDAVFSVKSITTVNGVLFSNSSFDGNTDKELLASGSILGPRSKAELDVELIVATSKQQAVYNNIAVVTGYSTGNGTLLEDISTDGFVPDPITIGDFSPNQPTPVNLRKEEIYIPEGFSPNNDGINDVFIIENALGKSINLEIYNRWGNLVYKSSNYQNNWTGICTEGIFVGQDVPVGTYYYVVKIDNQKKAGFITVNR